MLGAFVSHAPFVRSASTWEEAEEPWTGKNAAEHLPVTSLPCGVPRECNTEVGGATRILPREQQSLSAHTALDSTFSFFPDRISFIFLRSGRKSFRLFTVYILIPHVLGVDTYFRTTRRPFGLTFSPTVYAALHFLRPFLSLAPKPTWRQMINTTTLRMLSKH
jgi:hypothetical protein